MRLTFCAAVVVTMASLSGLNAAELRLSAEMPLGPAPQFTPGVAQSNVQIAYASSHTLAVWTTDRTLFGALDGAPVAFSVSNPFDLVILGVAGGRTNFLVVFAAYNPTDSLFAVRVGFDGRVLDPSQIVIPIGAYQLAGDGEVAYDGSEFVTVNLRKRQGLPSVIAPPEFVTARISDDGVAHSGAVFKFPSSQPSVPLQPRIAWTGTRFVAGYGVRNYTYDAPWGISAVPFEPDAANDLTLGQTAFPDLRGREGVIRMAIAGDRVTFVWLVPGNDAAIKVAQTDLDGRPVSAPKALAVPAPGLSNPADGDIRIAWDGSEYLVTWIAAGLGAPGNIRGIRLRYDATPIDAQPFDIAADSLTTSLSLTTTAHGFAIAYSRADLTNGGKPRAFVRTLEGLPAPRRRAAGR